MKKNYIHLQDLRVHVVQQNGLWMWLPVSSSPYYLTILHDDKSYFENYHELLKKYSRHTFHKEISYKDFERLFLSIKDRFIFSEPFIRSSPDNPYHILDGQHRLAILQFLYENPKLCFFNNEMKLIQWQKLNA